MLSLNLTIQFYQIKPVFCARTSSLKALAVIVTIGIKSFEAGMNVHLTKPIEPKIFYKTIKELVSKKK